ncbi:MAG TPA: IS66 family transposase [Candidatus Krumholzibacteria bacterium]
MNKPKKSGPARDPSGASAKRGRPNVQPVDIAKVNAIVDQTANTLSAADHGTLKAAMGTLAFLTAEIEARNTSIKRLRAMLFGSKTEKTDSVLGNTDNEGEGDTPGTSTTTDKGSIARAEGGATDKPKPKGHGRQGAAALTGATRICVPHDSLKRGELCPGCGQGKVYPMPEPKLLVRITGMAPLSATVTELERLRCNLCGKIFTAPTPPGTGSRKYDESVASMIGLLKYGAGVPFNRLEKLQVALGIPVSSSTQWELVDAAAALMVPAYQELVTQAAQGELLYNDDTTMRILALGGKRRAKAIAAGELDRNDRKGVFTSGIVSTAASTRSGHKIVLFFTGTQHAGENLADVLALRAPELADPIQMCDGLSHNTTPSTRSLIARCMTHARRKFVDVIGGFPEECAAVIEAIREVYRIDDQAKAQELDPKERLALHVEHSRPHMVRLKRWLRLQLSEKRIERNSGFGDAISYTLKHWEALTLFLRKPGAPLDNNICERALKRAILHRKNAYFYKTENGARVGDLYMSLIYSAEMAGTSPLEYLNALQVHHAEVARDPAAWMPWNYIEALACVAVPGPV